MAAGRRLLTPTQVAVLRKLGKSDMPCCRRRLADDCVSERVIEQLRAYGLARWTLTGATITDHGRDVLALIERHQRVAA